MILLPFREKEFNEHAHAYGDEEKQLYLALLSLYYGEEKPLSINPADAFAVARLCMTLGFDPHMRRILRRLLAERFVTLPAHQYHPRIEANLPRSDSAWPHTVDVIRKQLEAACLERAQ